MKFYVATSLKNVRAARRVIKRLTDLGHEITFDWTKCLGKKALEAIGRVSLAHAELQGVKGAEFVVWLWPAGRGSHVELGAALSARHAKRIYIVGAPKDDCIFYDAIFCLRWSSAARLLKALADVPANGTVHDLPPYSERQNAV